MVRDLDGVTAGNVRAVARALTTVERGGDEAHDLLRQLNGRLGRAWTVGFTGAPGVGKSTLVQALGLDLVGRGERIAAIAVDPSSPFSGGALLGDRVRMPDLVAAGGFVRSMATRGALGGLAATTADAVDVLDAAGFDWVLVETVGVGQDELDVARIVDTVVVVTVPGLGDDIQAAKAGILEIADVYAVNKADRPGVENEMSALSGMLELQGDVPWRPPIVRTVASTGEGIVDLADAIALHRVHLETGDRRAVRRRQRAVHRVRKILETLVERRLRETRGSRVDAVLEQAASGSLDARSAAERLLAEIFREDG